MNPSLSSDAQSAIDRLMIAADAENRRVLYEHEVYAILRHLGLTTPVHAFVQSEAAVDPGLLSLFSSEKIVLKAVAGDLTHKLEAGGVNVVYKDLAFVKYSIDRMVVAFADRNVSLEGILLVEHVSYSQELGNETLLGFR